MSAGIQDILKNLYADKVIVLEFPNEQERELFRVKLYKAKKIQDEAMSAVLDEERQTLRAEASSFESPDKLGTKYYLKLYLEEKKESSFTIVSISDRGTDAAGRTPDDSQIAEKVRASLDKTNGGTEQGS